MTHRPFKGLLASGLAMTLLAAGCSGRSSSDGGDSGGGSDTSTSGAFINPADDCTDYKGTAGISGDTITVGTVRPASGPYSIYNRVTDGIEAYFNMVNAQGGVKAGDGKTYKLKLLKEDDQYDPSKTPDRVKKLVEQDNVFALVGDIGTETNLSVRDYLNEKCVPSVALATGSTEWGKADQYPWYISGLPSYATEATRFMDYLTEKKPDATIAVLYQNDDFGEAYLAAIKKYIADNDSKMKVVAEKSFDPTAGQNTQAVTTELAASKADVFFVGIGGTPCAPTLGYIPSSWKPMSYVSITCSVGLSLALAGDAQEGVFSTQATFDPGAPSDANEPAVKAFREALTKQGKTESDITGGILAAGWGFGTFFVEGLKESKTVDRATLMNSLYSMKNVTGGLLRTGVTFNTDNAKDPWPLEQLRVVQRKNKDWVEAAPLKDYNGESNSLAGK